MNLKNGTSLQGGRYSIEKVIGQGGFGITYKGLQVSLNRKVAIKEFFMKELCERDIDSSYVSVPSTGSREVVEKFRQKFLKEARNIANFNCKGIVSVIDVFEENGTAYYVMDYLGGGSLAEKVKNGPLPEPVALRYIHQVAESLSYLHGKNVMHLDIKPANILLGEDGNAVLIDFGLSKQYDGGGKQTSTTPVGLSHGYAPMEQYSRGGVSSFSPATDIYSLGATLYKLLTGFTPPEASELLNNGLPAMPDTVSKATQDAVVAAMQPQISKRPENIAEFISLLSVGSPVQSPEETVLVGDNGIQVIDTPVALDGQHAVLEPVTHGDDDTVYSDDVTVVKSVAKKNRLPLVNAFIIMEAVYLLLNNVTVFMEDSEFSNLLLCVQFPLSLVFSIVLLFFVKGSKAVFGASLMIAFTSLRLIMNLSCYDSSLFFFDLTTAEELNIYMLIYDAISYLLLLPAYGYLLSGSGASGKLTQAVTGSYALLFMFSFGWSMCSIFEDWDMSALVSGLFVIYCLIASIYLITYCSMTFSERLKSNRRSSSTVWIMIRLFIVMFLISGVMPLFAGFGEFSSITGCRGNICLFDIVNNVDVIDWFYLPIFVLLMINFLQSLVLPRKWINGVVSALAVALIVTLLIISDGQKIDYGMIVAMISSLALFVLTFIPAKK